MSKLIHLLIISGCLGLSNLCYSYDDGYIYLQQQRYNQQARSNLEYLEEINRRTRIGYYDQDEQADAIGQAIQNASELQRQRERLEFIQRTWNRN